MKPSLTPSEYASLVQLPAFSSEAELHRATRQRHGKAYASRLRKQLNLSDEPEAIAERYALLFESLETARTFQLALLNAGLIEYLTWWSAQELPDGDILDVGCGAGFAACFFALNNPDRQVMGIDIEPRAIACAMELAESLELDNVTFTTADLLHFSSPSPFANVNSFNTLNAITDLYRDPIGTFAYLPEVKRLLETSDHPALGTMARLLRPDGILTCVERVPHPLFMATMIGAYGRNGLYPQPGSIARVQSVHAFHGPETTTAVIFGPTGVPASEKPGFLRELGSRFDDFGNELRASELSNVRFRRGIEVRWPSEPDEVDPIAHLYDFVADGVRFYYETTTRGFRCLKQQSDHPVLGENPDFEEALERYTPVYEGQCEHQALTFADLMHDLGQTADPHAGATH